MKEVLLQLGDTQFTISGPVYDELEQSSSYRWAEQPRLRRRPARQFVGLGGESITLTGRIYTAFDPIGNNVRVGAKHVDNLRAQAAAGVPLMLISGYGKKFGRFCITEVMHKESILFADGVPRVQDFTLTLERYGEDRSGDEGIILEDGKFHSPRIDTNPNLPQRALA